MPRRVRGKNLQPRIGIKETPGEKVLLRSDLAYKKGDRAALINALRKMKTTYARHGTIPDEQKTSKKMSKAIKAKIAKNIDRKRKNRQLVIKQASATALDLGLQQ